MHQTGAFSNPPPTGVGDKWFFPKLPAWVDFYCAGRAGRAIQVLQPAPALCRGPMGLCRLALASAAGGGADRHSLCPQDTTATLASNTVLQL